jgi:hypothetical protein
MKEICYIRNISVGSYSYNLGISSEQTTGNPIIRILNYRVGLLFSSKSIKAGGQQPWAGTAAL